MSTLGRRGRRGRPVCSRRQETGSESYWKSMGCGGRNLAYRITCVFMCRSHLQQCVCVCVVLFSNNAWRLSVSDRHEPDYVAEYPIDGSINVLLWKEWFELRNRPKPLTPLIFCLKSEITLKSKVSYHSITVSGDVYVRDKIERLIMHQGRLRGL